MLYYVQHLLIAVSCTQLILREFNLCLLLIDNILCLSSLSAVTLYFLILIDFISQIILLIAPLNLDLFLCRFLLKLEVPLARLRGRYRSPHRSDRVAAAAAPSPVA